MPWPDWPSTHPASGPRRGWPARVEALYDWEANVERVVDLYKQISRHGEVLRHLTGAGQPSVARGCQQRPLAGSRDSVGIG